MEHSCSPSQDIRTRMHARTHTHARAVGVAGAPGPPAFWIYIPWICSWSRSRYLLGWGLNPRASSLSFSCCRCCSSSLLLLCTSSCSSSSSLRPVGGAVSKNRESDEIYFCCSKFFRSEVLPRLPLLAELHSCSSALLLFDRLLFQDGPEGSLTARSLEEGDS